MLETTQLRVVTLVSGSTVSEQSSVRSEPSEHFVVIDPSISLTDVVQFICSSAYPLSLQITSEQTSIVKPVSGSILLQHYSVRDSPFEHEVVLVKASSIVCVQVISVSPPPSSPPIPRRFMISLSSPVSLTITVPISMISPMSTAGSSSPQAMGDASPESEHFHSFSSSFYSSYSSSTTSLFATL